MRKLKLILLTLSFMSCGDYSCKNEVISEFLLEFAIDNEYNYCQLYSESSKGDLESIKEISLLSFYDGLVYEHGLVLISLINKLGEDKYLESLTDTDIDERKKICSYLRAGLNHGNIKEATEFSKIFKFCTGGF